ncbi:MAG: GntR family transcriptional regulator [Coprococcus sp.]
MIALDLKSNKPIYEQIIAQYKFHIMKGHLKAGDAIPSVRKLALELKITPGTVAKAYQELERQNIIETIRGKGTFIASDLTEEVNEFKLAEIRKQLEVYLTELKLMGFDEDKIIELVKSVYKEMGI